MVMIKLILFKDLNPVFFCYFALFEEEFCI